jgi:hypothetical protein
VQRPFVPQVCSPHSESLQQFAEAMQAPLHSLYPVRQLEVEHVFPLPHVKFPLHSLLSQQPEVAMQFPPHGLVPEPHEYTHRWLDGSHIPTLLACGAQSESLQHWPAHAYSQLRVLVLHVAVKPCLGAQSALAQHSPQRSPQSLPMLHLKPQVVPSQMGSASPDPRGQVSHADPHAMIESFAKQASEQTCWFAGQVSAIGVAPACEPADMLVFGAD